jgi:hypothetical protein
LRIGASCFVIRVLRRFSGVLLSNILADRDFADWDVFRNGGLARRTLVLHAQVRCVDNDRGLLDGFHLGSKQVLLSNSLITFAFLLLGRLLCCVPLTTRPPTTATTTASPSRFSRLQFAVAVYGLGIRVASCCVVAGG